jgi:hypothetical protein
MRIAFLVPGPLSATSGGYIYDRRLIAGLEALGHGCAWWSWRAGTRCRMRRPGAAQAALDGLAADELAVLDSLGSPPSRRWPGGSAARSG